MNYILVFTIAVSLSLDAFSLALAYGTLKIDRNKIFFIAALTGLFHFIMPLIGDLIGHELLHFFKADLVAFFLLTIIGVSMIYESGKEKEIFELSVGKMFLFAFTVSLDSFSAGIGLSGIVDNIFLAVFSIAISSFAFTGLGLVLGKKIGQKLGKYATVFGGIALILIAIMCLVYF